MIIDRLSEYITICKNHKCKQNDHCINCNRMVNFYDPNELDLEKRTLTITCPSCSTKNIFPVFFFKHKLPEEEVDYIKVTSSFKYYY